MPDLLPDFQQRLTQRNAAALEALGERDVRWIRQEIGIPVEITPQGVIRSSPGEPPRKETGELQSTIEAQAEMSGEGASVSVSAGPAMGAGGEDYAYVLEFGGLSAGVLIQPRPYMHPAFEMTAASALEFIAARLRQ